MKVYLAGPMRGFPEWNFPAFADAKKRLEEAGHQVFCPATMDKALGYPAGSEHENNAQHLRHVMQNDVTCLMNADAIALLPGWEKSRGATVELALAQFLGLKTICAITLELDLKMETPWGRILQYQQEVAKLTRTIQTQTKPFNPLLRK